VTLHLPTTKANYFNSHALTLKHKPQSLTGYASAIVLMRSRSHCFVYHAVSMSDLEIIGQAVAINLPKLLLAARDLGTLLCPSRSSSDGKP